MSCMILESCLEFLIAKDDPPQLHLLFPTRQKCFLNKEFEVIENLQIWKNTLRLWFLMFEKIVTGKALDPPPPPQDLLVEFSIFHITTHNSVAKILALQNRDGPVSSFH